MGIDRTVVDKDIYSVISNKCGIQDAVLDTELPFFKLIPSSRNLARFELEVSELDENHLYLKDSLGRIKGEYDFIIIDSPPSLGLLTINSLTASDSVLIPIQSEYYALEGLSDLNDTIERIRDGFNKSRQIEGILITMFDERTNLSRQVEEEIRGFFKTKVYRSVIPRNVRLSEASSFGKPIQLYEIKSAGSKAYMALAREMLNQ